jgi:hypothetical protein
LAFSSVSRAIDIRRGAEEPSGNGNGYVSLSALKIGDFEEFGGLYYSYNLEEK